MSGEGGVTGEIGDARAGSSEAASADQLSGEQGRCDHVSGDAQQPVDEKQVAQLRARGRELDGQILSYSQAAYDQATPWGNFGDRDRPLTVAEGVIVGERARKIFYNGPGRDIEQEARANAADLAAALGLDPPPSSEG